MPALRTAFEPTGATRKVVMKSLKDQASAGLLWSIVGSWGGKAISMLIFVALARLIQPASFGIVALVAVFITLMDMLVQQGLTEALVQRKNLNDRLINTAFVVNITLGIVFVTALYLIAPLIAAQLSEPKLTPVLRASGATVLVTALCSTQIALYRRNFQYKLLAKRSIASSVIGGLIGLVIAALGGEEWSLVGQALSAATMSALLLWRTPLWRPRLEFDRTGFTELLSYGSSIFGSSILSFLLTKGTDLLIGATMGTVALGLYTVGSRATLLMLQLFTGAVSDVAMSGLSRVSHDQEKLLNAYYSIVKLSGAVACPAFALVAAIAPEFCIAVFGPEWASSGAVLQATSLLAVIQCIQFYNSTCFNAVGMPRLTLFLNAFKLIFVYASFLLTWKHGLVAVAYGLVAGQAISTPLNYYFASKYIGIRVERVLADIFPFLLAGFAMVASVATLRHLFHSGEPWLDLGIYAVAGCLIYSAIIFMFGRRQFRDVISTARDTLNSRRKKND